MKPLRLLVGYDGSRFSGFQAQPEVRTVQGVLEDALARLAQRPVRLRGAGRTDAGVHALGQVVSIDDPAGLDPDMVMRALPGILPPYVSVLDAQLGPEGFDARRSALWRSYVYLLWCHEAPHPLYRPYSHWVRGDVDACRMREALALLVGTHDFSSFARVREDQSPERTIVEATAVRDCPFVRIRVVGQSFLHQMVRSIVGTAIEVGVGRRPVSWMAEVLATRDRSAAGQVAPPEGLALVDVGYPEEVDWPRRPQLSWPWSDVVYPADMRGCA